MSLRMPASPRRRRNVSKSAVVRVVAERGLDRLEERALAGRGGPVREQQDLLAGVAGEGVADDSLQEPGELVVAAGGRVDEPFPVGRAGVGVVGDGRELGCEVGRVVWAELAGAEVDRAVVGAQQPRVGVELLGERDHVRARSRRG